ncbi:DMT family transporter [Lacibacterium aquatile]|uniref:DMT family transporter n=1 Tax=Lacibacterium aquatile TaxID=1168082 RepID=A0ABW5DR31_9PROT
MKLLLPPRDLLLVFAAICVWGYSFVPAKYALEVLPPMALLAIRFGVTGLLFLPFARMHRRQFVGILIFSFVMGVGHFGLNFAGLQYVGASTATLVGQLQVPFGVMVGLLLYREKIDSRQIIGILLAFLGVGIFLSQGDMHFDWWGVFLMAMSALAWVLANVAVKKVDLRPAATLAWMNILAAPQFLVLSLLTETVNWGAVGEQGLSVTLSLLYMIIGGTCIGYGAWYALLSRHPISLLSPFMLLIPVVGVMSGVLFLGEQLTVRVVIGGLLTVVGVGIINIRPRVQTTETA